MGAGLKTLDLTIAGAPEIRNGVSLRFARRGATSEKVWELAINTARKLVVKPGLPSADVKLASRGTNPGWNTVFIRSEESGL
jgi:hypothetical protein